MHSCWHLHILGWAARQRSMPAFWGMQPWQSVLKYTLVNFHYLPVRRFTFKFSLWYSVYCEKHPSFVSEPPGTDKALIHCSPSTPSYVLPTHAAAVLPSTPSTFSSTQRPSFPIQPNFFPTFPYQRASFWSLVLFYDHCQLFEARKVFMKQAKITSSILKRFCPCFVI